MKAVALGMPQQQIADFLCIDIKTLKKHYGDELRHGRFVAVQSVAGVAFEMAMSGKDPKSTHWWLERIGGFTEGGAAGLAVSVNVDNRQIQFDQLIEGGL